MEKIYEENNIYDEPLLPRYGHIMHLIDNKLYILGGNSLIRMKMKIMKEFYAILTLKNILGICYFMMMRIIIK